LTPVVRAAFDSMGHSSDVLRQRYINHCRQEIWLYWQWWYYRFQISHCK